MFCLATKARLANAFLLPDEHASFQKRTLAMLKEDGQRYDEMMNSYVGSERDKKRSDITQNHTHSTIASPMADVPPDVCTPASVHVILGE